MRLPRSCDEGYSLATTKAAFALQTNKFIHSKEHGRAEQSNNE
jgi:hypothetical protein